MQHTSNVNVDMVLMQVLCFCIEIQFLNCTQLIHPSLKMLLGIEKNSQGKSHQDIKSHGVGYLKKVKPDFLSDGLF